MISVSHLTKRFPGHTAVDDVSFEVGKGEVVGFLGPNGAGKTTTIRILAGFMPATGGQVKVAGYDVFTESLEVRRRIGYLPENCPLYNEMRVDEFLNHRAALRGLDGQKRKRRIRQVKETCGIERVGRRIIGQLSKGYRQRVGLAECLVHEPELIMLDEPTIGLDPNQIRQVRELIKRLAEHHTVLLSTHILSEVEMTCQRVIIINKGRIAAAEQTGSLTKLLKKGSRVNVELQGPVDDIRRTLQNLPGVSRITVKPQDGWVHAELTIESEMDIRPDIFSLAVGRGWTIRELNRAQSSLEDVFLSVTKGKEWPAS